jgi:hypothetical protein
MNLLRRATTLAMIAIFATSISATAPVDQPFMQAGLKNLKDAQNSLKKATAEKGGHRERAIDLTTNAFNSVNKGIEYDRNNYTPRTRQNSTDGELETTLADQPNMVKAREHLQAAMTNLRKASADKGGYREQAMGHINNAISAVNAGIAYDRAH